MLGGRLLRRPRVAVAAALLALMLAFAAGLEATAGTTLDVGDDITTIGGTAETTIVANLHASDDIDSWDITLTFDPALISAEGVTFEGDWTQFIVDIDNNLGTIQVAGTQFVTFCDGGTACPLATIEWEGLAQGTSNVAISTEQVARAGVEITGIVSNAGEVIVAGAPGDDIEASSATKLTGDNDTCSPALPANAVLQLNTTYYYCITVDAEQGSEGDGIIDELLIEDNLPAEVLATGVVDTDFTPGSGGCAVTAGELSCDAGELLAGESARVSVEFQLSGSDSGQDRLVVNSATFRDDGGGADDGVGQAQVSNELPFVFVNNALDVGTGGCNLSGCTLREAIAAANLDPDITLINFSLPGAAPFVISPTSALPAVLGGVTFAGLSQPGATCEAPLVQINGAGAGGATDGLRLQGESATVDGLVIRNFGGDGISVEADGATITCSRIGTDVDLAPQGNGSAGVRVAASGVLIGGDGLANVIAFNGAAGVAVASGTGVNVPENSIYSNGGPGIDLGADGVTEPDPDDTDTGANNLQNQPVLTFGGLSGADFIVDIALDSAPSASYEVHIYLSSSCTPSRNGEALLDTTTLGTDGSGVDTDNALVAAADSGRFVTATATDEDGNTSEFSNCLQVGSAPACDGLPATFVGGPGPDVMYGTGGDDVMFGGVGPDEIHGLNGVDRICGFDGADTIFGDAGNDILLGQKGGDTIDGGAGEDDIRGATGSDELFGGPDNDSITGATSPDTISGGGGNDLIFGNDQADQISGDAGDDDLRGGKGIDTLNGGTDFDTCNGNTGIESEAVHGVACEVFLNYDGP